MMRFWLICISSLLLFVSCRKETGADAGPLLDKAIGAMERHDFATALNYASDALEIMPSDGIPERRADALLVMSRAHAAAGNFSAAMTYAREACIVAPEYEFALRSLVDAATSAGESSLALATLDSIPATDGEGAILSLRQSIVPALASGQTDRAVSALKSLFADSLWLSVEHRVALAEYYNRSGKPDSSEIVLKGAELEPDLRPSDLRALASFRLSSGRSAMALQSWQRLASVQDSIMEAVSAAGIYGKLYSQEHIRRLEEAQSARSAKVNLVIVTASCLIVLIILLVVILYLRSTHRRRMLEAENRILMAAEELRRLSEHSRSTIGRLFRESYESVEMAANMLIDSSASSNVAANIRSRLERRIEACRSPKFIADLEREVNICHENIINILRETVPSVSDAEMTVALYCSAGLSSRVICLLLDCTPSALYNKKYRLKCKIRSSGAPAATVEKLIELIN